MCFNLRKKKGVKKRTSDPIYFSTITKPNTDANGLYF